MMVTAQWFKQFATKPQYNTPEIANLVGTQAISLERRGQTIKVQSGSVWISFDGRDHVLKQGQNICIGNGKHVATISSAELQETQIKIITEA
jgi:hypothetical protein